MNTLDDTLYYALQGLETRLAMQYNCHLGWSCRHIVRTGIEVAQTMLGDEDVEAHKESYYTLISRRMSSEARETMMVIIVMRVLFGLIENDSQARRCRSTFAEDWCDEIEDMYHSYRRAVDEQIDTELVKQPNQTFTVTVMRTEQPQTVINVAGNYIAEQHIDIHDNTNCNIYATAQEPKEEKEPPQQSTPQTEEVAFEELNTHFRYITESCVKKNMVEHVEAHLRAACKGSAEALWKTIHDFEFMGYLCTQDIDASKIYNALSDYFCPLKFTERNFRKYRL